MADSSESFYYASNNDKGCGFFFLNPTLLRNILFLQCLELIKCQRLRYSNLKKHNFNQGFKFFQLSPFSKENNEIKGQNLPYDIWASTNILMPEKLSEYPF